jgi:NAD(P)-dependent dehydrogenase (short-subunit alcohol dehydrogenase family)
VSEDRVLATYLIETPHTLEFPLDSWRAYLDINVTGVLLCAQHGAGLMMRAP